MLRRYAIQLSVLTHTGMDFFLSIPVKELREIGADVAETLKARNLVKAESVRR